MKKWTTLCSFVFHDDFPVKPINFKIVFKIRKNTKPFNSAFQKLASRYAEKINEYFKKIKIKCT